MGAQTGVELYSGGTTRLHGSPPPLRRRLSFPATWCRPKAGSFARLMLLSSSLMFFPTHPIENNAVILFPLACSGISSTLFPAFFCVRVTGLTAPRKGQWLAGDNG